MREPFTQHSGIFAPLLVDNVDTDQIIPSREIKSVGRTGLKDGLFAGWRYLANSARKPNPDFVLNRAGYENATILISGENFGCGSSREHAVWALSEYGIRAIIASSFGEIFYNNCIRNGVLPVRLSKEQIRAMANLPVGTSLMLDLPNQTVTYAGTVHNFEVGPYAKRLLVEGLDPIGLTLKDQDRITAFQDADRNQRPWIYS